MTSGNVAYAGAPLTSVVTGDPLDCSGGCTIVVQGASGVCAPILAGPWAAAGIPVEDCNAEGTSWAAATPNHTPGNLPNDTSDTFTCLVLSDTTQDVATAPFSACQSAYPPAYYTASVAPTAMSSAFAGVARDVQATLTSAAPVGLTLLGVTVGLVVAVTLVRRITAGGKS